MHKSHKARRNSTHPSGRVEGCTQEYTWGEKSFCHFLVRFIFFVYGTIFSKSLGIASIFLDSESGSV